MGASQTVQRAEASRSALRQIERHRRLASVADLQTRMPLPDVQIRECLVATGEFLSRHRPPPEIRDKVDYRADIKGQEVTISEVRPRYDDETRKAEHPFAKARWVGTRKVWRLFWMRGDLKWHSYESFPESPNIGTLLEEVTRDPHCCFFG